MTNLIIMYDALDLSQIPRNAQAAAGYVNGRWPTFAHLHGQFPSARLLSIAVTAGADAECLDIETGDATPADAAGWFERQKALGVVRPGLYASASLMESAVIPAMKAAGIDRASVRLWSAHYTGSPHICGPSSCRLMNTAADGTQWTNRALGRDLDESLLLADFFAVPAAPAPPTAPSAPPWQETMLNNLPVLSEGDTDEAGHVFFVHRAQALAKVYGQITGLPEAAALEVTGTYDAATKAAVEQVQGHARITVDGIVGADTWSVLITGSAS